MTNSEFWAVFCGFIGIFFVLIKFSEYRVNKWIDSIPDEVWKDVAEEMRKESEE